MSFLSLLQLTLYIVIEGIKVAGTVIGDGVSNFLTNYKEVGITIGAFSALALGIYTARLAICVSF
jgi:hypothetical protein